MRQDYNHKIQEIIQEQKDVLLSLCQEMKYIKSFKEQVKQWQILIDFKHKQIYLQQNQWSLLNQQQQHDVEIQRKFNILTQNRQQLIIEMKQDKQQLHVQLQKYLKFVCLIQLNDHVTSDKQQKINMLQNKNVCLLENLQLKRINNEICNKKLQIQSFKSGQGERLNTSRNDMKLKMYYSLALVKIYSEYIVIQRNKKEIVKQQNYILRLLTQEKQKIDYLNQLNQQKQLFLSFYYDLAISKKQIELFTSITATKSDKIRIYSKCCECLKEQKQNKTVLYLINHVNQQIKTTKSDKLKLFGQDIINRSNFIVENKTLVQKIVNFSTLVLHRRSHIEILKKKRNEMLNLIDLQSIQTDKKTKQHLFDKFIKQTTQQLQNETDMSQSNLIITQRVLSAAFQQQDIQKLKKRRRSVLILKKYTVQKQIDEKLVRQSIKITQQGINKTKLEKCDNLDQLLQILKNCQHLQIFELISIKQKQLQKLIDIRDKCQQLDQNYTQTTGSLTLFICETFAIKELLEFNLLMSHYNLQDTIQSLSRKIQQVEYSIDQQLVIQKEKLQQLKSSVLKLENEVVLLKPCTKAQFEMAGIRLKYFELALQECQSKNYTKFQKTISNWVYQNLDKVMTESFGINITDSIRRRKLCNSWNVNFEKTLISTISHQIICPELRLIQRQRKLCDKFFDSDKQNIQLDVVYTILIIINNLRQM